MEHLEMFSVKLDYLTIDHLTCDLGKTVEVFRVSNALCLSFFVSEAYMIFSVTLFIP